MALAQETFTSVTPDRVTTPSELNADMLDGGADTGLADPGPEVPKDTSIGSPKTGLIEETFTAV